METRILRRRRETAPARVASDVKGEGDRMSDDVAWISSYVSKSGRPRRNVALPGNHPEAIPATRRGGAPRRQIVKVVAGLSPDPVLRRIRRQRWPNAVIALLPISQSRWSRARSRRRQGELSSLSRTAKYHNLQTRSTPATRSSSSDASSWWHVHANGARARCAPHAPPVRRERSTQPIRGPSLRAAQQRALKSRVSSRRVRQLTARVFGQDLADTTRRYAIRDERLTLHAGFGSRTRCSSIPEHPRVL